MCSHKALIRSICVTARIESVVESLLLLLLLFNETLVVYCTFVSHYYMHSSRSVAFLAAFRQSQSKLYSSNALSGAFYVCCRLCHGHSLGFNVSVFSLSVSLSLSPSIFFLYFSSPLDFLFRRRLKCEYIIIVLSRETNVQFDEYGKGSRGIGWKKKTEHLRNLKANAFNISVVRVC